MFTSTARPCPRRGRSNCKRFGSAPADHAIGRSRGGLTTKNHLVCDGKGRALTFVLTPGQTADTIMLIDTLSEIHVAGRTGRPVSARTECLLTRATSQKQAVPGYANETSRQQPLNAKIRSRTAA